MTIEEENPIKEQLNLEIKKLIINKWYFYESNWNTINKKYNHRTELKYIKEIRFIKDVLLKQLGYLPVFYFLNVIYGTSEYPGPFFEIDKALLLLYHLVCGFSGQKMAQFMCYATFYDLYKKFWITNYKKINKIINTDLLNLFSNIKIRLLAAKLHNPTGFKSVTLVIDGHDSKIKYYNPDVERIKLHSYKFKKPGFRTQIVADMNKMILFISDSEKCGESNDGSMFLKMNLYNKLHICDCLAMDGGYPLFINQFKENSINLGYEFKDMNFMYPARKEKDSNLSINELHFNKVFGSFRSTIENEFSVIGNKFGRFNNNRASVQVSDIKYYNLQFKLVCLLKNIWQLVQDYEIEELAHHKLWHSDKFEFPKIESKLQIAFNDETKINKNIKDIYEIQSKLLSMDLENSEADDIEFIEEDTIMEEIPIKTKKNKRTVIHIENFIDK